MDHKTWQNLRLAFLGTSEFALHPLQAVLETTQMVICQPDRPAGRGHKLTSPPVKALAAQKGIPVRQPEKLNAASEVLDELRELQPHLMVTAAYGQILSPEVLAIPEWGVWNVHASLLPRWRGAAPVNWCILAGDQITGVTIMRTEPGMDTGPILLQGRLPVTSGDTAPILASKLSRLGGELLRQAVQRKLRGDLREYPQDPSQATKATRLSKDMAPVNWSTMTAEDILRRWRALQPWPGVCFGEHGVKIVRASVASLASTSQPPGTCLGTDVDAALIACAQGTVLRLERVRPPNKTSIKGAEWWRNQGGS